MFESRVLVTASRSGEPFRPIRNRKWRRGNHFTPDVCPRSIEQAPAASKQKHGARRQKLSRSPAAPVRCHHDTEIMLHLHHRPFFHPPPDRGHRAGRVSRLPTHRPVAGGDGKHLNSWRTFRNMFPLLVAKIGRGGGAFCWQLSRANGPLWPIWFRFI